jgi:hypothetical protein
MSNANAIYFALGLATGFGLLRLLLLTIGK